MDWQKGKSGNYEAATCKVTAEELPFLYFVKPLILLKGGETSFINEPYVTGGNPILSSKDDGYISRIIRLTLLSPEIIHAIIAGNLEKDIGIEQLKQAMPLMWEDQKKMFGME